MPDFRCQTPDFRCQTKSLKINFMRKHDFKKLKVWQDAMLLVKDIYETTKNFPKDELFGLTQQIRRCAVSIP
ncbi:MAG: four helix bundle protein, partial [Saprospiraceae bacterium]